MKYTVLALVLSALLLGGCSSTAVRTDTAASNMERMIQSAGNGAESAAALPSGVTEGTADPLTKEQAEAIALQAAGVTADQVTRLRTEYEIDEGVPRFEVQFRRGRWDYDYEIDAYTGAILSYDRDDR